jgi:hypothetical protein
VAILASVVIIVGAPFVSVGTTLAILFASTIALALKHFEIPNNLFKLAQSFFREPRRDPLALDLDGDGLETSNFNVSNPIWFDHDVNGSAEGTGWLDSEAAIPGGSMRRKR